MPEDVNSYPGVGKTPSNLLDYPADYPRVKKEVQDIGAPLPPPIKSKFPGFDSLYPESAENARTQDPQQPTQAAEILDQEEVSIVREALQRGATEWQLVELLFGRRFGRLPGGKMDSQILQTMSKAVQPEMDWYRNLVTQEFNVLQHVQGVFNKQGAKGLDYGSALINYMKARPKYFNAGYSRPVDTIFRFILSPGQGAKLLGHPIKGGIHKEVLDRLDKLRDKLNAWEPGLADRTALEFKRVSGFQPRFIKGTIRLSNHAFGLAIDIDANVNPHIKNARVVEVLKRVTGFDYGKRLVEPSKAVGGMDYVMEIYNRAQEASLALKAWLEIQLPRDAQVQSEIDKSKQDIQVAKVKLAQAKTREERVQASNELDTAQNAWEQANRQRVDDPDLRDLQVLKKYHGKDIDSWSKYGIQTVPLALVVALRDLGFRWGQEYKSSKDGMHFELIAGQIIPPDSPPRAGFEDLLLSH